MKLTKLLGGKVFFKPLLVFFFLYSFFRLSFAQQKIVGYYAYWMESVLPPSKIEFSNLTYVMHAFAWPNNDGSIGMTNNFLDPALVHAVHSAGKKILVSIGGYGMSNGFVSISSDSNKQNLFVDNVINFLQTNGYDGIDLDWEFPYNAQLGAQLAMLVQKLREKFNQVNPAWLITMAVSGRPGDNIFYQYNNMVNYVDWFDVMCYDYVGSGSTVTGFNAPLYPNPQTNLGSDSTAINYFAVTQNIPRNKIVLGIPFYGYEFNSTGLFLPSTGNVSMINYSNLLDTVSSSGWTYYWDNVSDVPYYINLTQDKFITFDDTNSIKLKAEFEKKQKLGGVMIWALGFDLINGRQPLLEELGRTLGIDTSATFVSGDSSLFPKTYKLFNNYPNPFNPSTTIEYQIPNYSFVILKIYDALGNEIKTLVDGYRERGKYSVLFDASNLASGVYFCRLNSNGFTAVKKLTLLK